MLPTVAVFYAGGDLAPGALAEAASSLCALEFWVDEDFELSRPMARYLRTLGPVRRYAADDLVALATQADPRPHGVMAFSDHQLEVAAAAAEVWGTPFHSPATAHVLARKSLQRRALEASARPVPWVTWPENIADRTLDDLEGPLVVKHDRGAASVGSYAAGDVADALAHLEGLGDTSRLWVIEQRIPGTPPPVPGLADYVSVELLHTERGWHAFGVNGRCPTVGNFGETAILMPLDLGPALEAEVVDVAVEALDLMGVRHGACHVEVKLAPDGPVVIEVNGRLGGGVADLVARGAGWNLLHEIFLAALGRPVPVHDEPWDGVVGQVYPYPSADEQHVPEWPDVTGLLADPGVAFVQRLREPGEPVDPRGGSHEAYGMVGTRADDLESWLTLRRRVLDVFGRPTD